mgnify:CR=1 FL=1
MAMAAKQHDVDLVKALLENTVSLNLLPDEICIAALPAAVFECLHPYGCFSQNWGAPTPLVALFFYNDRLVGGFKHFYHNIWDNPSH